MDCIRDHADLLYAIGGNLLWSRVRRAFEKTFAECVRSVDPRIDFASRDADISRAIGQVAHERRLDRRFKWTPGLVRERLCEYRNRSCPL